MSKISPLHRFINQGRQVLIRVITVDLSEVNYWQRLLIIVPQLAFHAFRQFQRTMGSQMAAALAYATVLSLVPVTALIVLYSKVAGRLDLFSHRLQDWIVQVFVADVAQGIVQYIDTLIDNVHEKTLGTIGAGGLILSAYALLKTIEKSFNHVWMVSNHRSFWARLQMLSSLLIFVPTSLAGSLYISGKVQYQSAFESYPIVLPFLFTVLSFVFVFQLVPNTKVKFRAALAAAILCAIAFELSKYGFNVYITKIIRVHRIYGSLGLFPIFLIWIYLVWSIILIGVHISYALQHLKDLRQSELARLQSPVKQAGYHEEIALNICQKLAQLFQQGKPGTAAALIGTLPFAKSTITRHLSLLADHGLIGKVVQGEETLYVFLKPLESIATSDITTPIRKLLLLATPSPWDSQPWR